MVSNPRHPSTASMRPAVLLSALVATLAMSGCALINPQPSTATFKTSYDFSYAIFGDSLAKPVQAFSDGTNTFVQIRQNQFVADNAVSLPTDGAGNKQVLSFIRQGAYVIIPGVQRQFMIVGRDGRAVLVQHDSLPSPSDAAKVSVTGGSNVVPRTAPMVQPTQVSQTAAVQAKEVAQAQTSTTPPAASTIRPSQKATSKTLPDASIAAVTVTPTANRATEVTTGPSTLAQAVIEKMSAKPITEPQKTPVSSDRSSERVTIIMPARAESTVSTAIAIPEYAFNTHEKTTLQVLTRWARIAGYKLVLNGAAVTTQFPKHSVEYVDLPLLPDHALLPASGTLVTAITTLSRPFKTVDLSSVNFVVDPQQDKKTLFITSQMRPPVKAAVTPIATPAAAPVVAVATPTATPAAQPPLPVVAAPVANNIFAILPTDKTFIGILSRWASLSGYKTQLNGAFVDMATFPTHSTAFTDFGLTEAAKALKPTGSFVGALQGITAAFGNQDLSAFKMQLLGDKRILAITSTPPVGTTAAVSK